MDNFQQFLQQFSKLMHVPRGSRCLQLVYQHPAFQVWFSEAPFGNQTWQAGKYPLNEVLIRQSYNSKCGFDQMCLWEWLDSARAELQNKFQFNFSSQKSTKHVTVIQGGVPIVILDCLGIPRWQNMHLPNAIWPGTGKKSFAATSASYSITHCSLKDNIKARPLVLCQTFTASLMHLAKIFSLASEHYQRIDGKKMWCWNEWI